MNANLSVGVIGLGAMGMGMAQSLRRAGHVVNVFDVRADVAQKFAAEGGVACASLEAIAATSDILVSVVVNAAQTESVLFGDGTPTSGCASHLKPGSVFVMCSTVEPAFSVGLEKKLNDKGLLYIDAPISGGAAKAASGQMTMMTAGTPAAYAKAESFLNAMAAKVYKLGDSAGAGSKVKIINQLLAGVHIAAAAEARPWVCAKALTPMHFTKSLQTAQATAGCLKIAWRMCWLLTTRLCLLLISLSKT